MPVGPGQPAAAGIATEPIMSRRVHPCLDLAGLAVRGLRHRRVCPSHRGLMREQLNVRRLRARCSGTSSVRPPARTRRQPRPPRRQGVSIRQHSPQGATGRGRHRRSVGSKGDSYDNALAETINELSRGKFIHRRGPWKSKEAVEFASLEWVPWLDHHRLLEPIGHMPKAEAEPNHHRQLAGQAIAVTARPKPNRLHESRGYSAWPAPCDRVL